MKLLLFALLTFILSLTIIFSLAISFSANTIENPELSHENLIKLKNKLSANNPFKTQRTELKRISLDEKMVNEGVRLVLSNYSHFPISIKLNDGYAQVTTSPALSVLSINLYVNIRFNASVKNNMITFTKINIGALPIPSFIYNLTYPYIKHTLRKNYPEYDRLFSNIHQISLVEEKISIVYQWDRRFSQHAQQVGKNLLITKNEQNLIAIYYRQLSKNPHILFRKKASLHKIIQPLFSFTKTRVGKGNDPVNENRAAILTLGIFASGIRINHLIKLKKNQHFRHLHYGRITLSGRGDLMRHFLISAALTVTTNKTLAEAIGLSKELNDANEGSGFSFADLLADKAGVAFANMATNVDTANLFLTRIAAQSLSSSSFMPPHGDLPESITGLEFKRIYIDINTKKYQYIEDEISRRVNQLPLLSRI